MAEKRLASSLVSLVVSNFKCSLDICDVSENVCFLVFLSQSDIHDHISVVLACLRCQPTWFMKKRAQFTPEVFFKLNLVFVIYVDTVSFAFTALKHVSADCVGAGQQLRL